MPATTRRFHHTLILRLPSCPFVLDADAARLTQVLTNLLDNAVQFTDRPRQDRH